MSVSNLPYLREEYGAVSVDWLALAAGVMLISAMTVYLVFAGTHASLVKRIEQALPAAIADSGDALLSARKPSFSLSTASSARAAAPKPGSEGAEALAFGDPTAFGAADTELPVGRNPFSVRPAPVER